MLAAGAASEGRSERERMVPEPDEGRASDLIRLAWELTDVANHATDAVTAARAIELEPNNALAHTIRAWALENLGEANLGEARSVYEAALALDATAPWPRTGLADLLHRAGNKGEAELLYRDVVKDTAEPPDDRPRSLEFRGWSLYRLGRLDEAISSHPKIADLPRTTAIRELLRLELIALGPPGTPSSDRPGAAI